jgi:tRNA A37 threonylcarbamoyltransferase TsaD
MLAQVAAEHGAKFGFGPNEFNADNGGMIAFVAERMLKAGKRVDIKECVVKQRYRIDEAEVF